MLLYFLPRLVLWDARRAARVLREEPGAVPEDAGCLERGGDHGERGA